MSWPSDLRNVDCTGFNPKILPLIRTAIDSDEVTWIDGNLFIDSGIGKFEWKNCIWEIQEFTEIVSSITLISGLPDDPDLTMFVLTS